MERDGGSCVLCGELAVVVDHREPVVEGGKIYDAANLRSLCADCHEAEHRRRGQT